MSYFIVERKRDEQSDILLVKRTHFNVFFFFFFPNQYNFWTSYYHESLVIIRECSSDSQYLYFTLMKRWKITHSKAKQESLLGYNYFIYASLTPVLAWSTYCFLDLFKKKKHAAFKTPHCANHLPKTTPDLNTICLSGPRGLHCYWTVQAFNKKKIN